ncbi:bis-aminopropyl spermidine synthase family protein [Patescibacteria group bacterium]|nr:bis-aminopropyl spermidine synthase family protein [Patescibacteria group bacterium]
MNFDLRSLDITKFLYHLSKSPQISTQSLIRQTGLPKSQLYSLLKEYSHLLSPPARSLSLKPEFRQKILAESQATINSIENLDIKTIKAHLFPALSQRPSPSRDLDQFFATKHTTLRRVKKMAKMGDIHQRHLAFLGDDDFTSIAVALTHQAKSITVFEIDDRLINIIKKISTDLSLNIEVVKQDLSNDIDKIFYHTFDTVFTDPPYTPNGVSLFTNQAINLLNPAFTSRLYLCYGNSDRAREREVVIQKIISDFAFLIHSKYFHFNHYQGAQSIGSSSSLYLLDWTPALKNKEISLNKIYTHQK